MTAQTQRWHSLFRACLSCHRTDARYEARGLCKPCYEHMVTTRQLYRFPRLTDSAAGNTTTGRRRAHRAAKWQRERIICWRPLATDRPHIDWYEAGESPRCDTSRVA